MNDKQLKEAKRMRQNALERKKLSCISMIHSVIAYDWNERDNGQQMVEKELQRKYSYLKDYVEELGMEAVVKYAQECIDQVDYIKRNTYTDGEGLSYNSIIWKEEN